MNSFPCKSTLSFCKYKLLVCFQLGCFSFMSQKYLLIAWTASAVPWHSFKESRILAHMVGIIWHLFVFDISKGRTVSFFVVKYWKMVTWDPGSPTITSATQSCSIWVREGSWHPDASLSKEEWAEIREAEPCCYFKSHILLFCFFFFPISLISKLLLTLDFFL